MKTLELYESQFSKYTKKPGEDLNSILTGIVQEKGRVHFELCEPISYAELAKFENATNNEYHKLVAPAFSIAVFVLAYRLYPNNYIAYDLRYGTTKYKDCYTDEQKKVFMQHLQALEKYDTCDIENLKDIFLGIYSNPVNNK